ncbi:hypothetical protein [Bifidobacterium sp. SO1]|uniref:hypothetical protein n=1 Tax=Bifidobacterium sp. SO1 TaxID=2809029 RepID=UPI001BDC913A|nr:hypothetical protein [Bifidobacterium sp. SO1]MBT1162120.1 hypothetical protein [Bifidobacterium sp. SO1]
MVGNRTLAICCTLLAILTIGGCSDTNWGEGTSETFVGTKDSIVNLSDGKWHGEDVPYNGSYDDSYRYSTFATPDGVMHCITYNAYRAGGLSCWPADTAK